MGIFNSGSSGNQQWGNSSGGYGIRLLIGAAIALFGWFSYLSHTEENPITGEKQHLSLSPNQEIKLGLDSAPAMARQMGGELSSSDPRTQVVQNMGAYLVEKSIAHKSPWNFKFHLLADNQTINAFALPGGQIFITEGLLSKLQNEAQLAGVLAHEMGHVIERHTAEQMAKQQLGQTMVLAVGAAASSDQSNRALMMAAFVNQMMQLRYSRQDESQADEWGIRLMSSVGFDPTAMIDVMKILKAVSGSKGAAVEMFQTHPNPDLRIKQIKEYLEKNPSAPGLSQGKNLKELYHKQENL